MPPDQSRAPQFWGGYELEFKVLEQAKYEKNAENIRTLRTTAIDVGSKKRFKTRSGP